MQWSVFLFLFVLFILYCTVFCICIIFIYFVFSIVTEIKILLIDQILDNFVRHPVGHKWK
jgi:hypothetical protein